MKRRLIFFLSCYICLSAVYAQPQVPKKKGPIVEIVGEECHSFGDLPSGPEVKYKFVFINAGDEPLEIREVMNSVAYANAEWTKGPILPGKKGFIIEYLNTMKRGGKFTSSIYIRSNARNPNCALGYKLSIKGFIDKNDF